MIVRFAPRRPAGFTQERRGADSRRAETASSAVADQSGSDGSDPVSTRVLPLCQEELLTLLAHDIRSPLHTLGMSADLLQQKISSSDSLVIRQFDVIRRTLAQINDLVSDVLVMSGAFDSSTASICSLAEALERAVSELTAYADQSGVTLSLATPSDVSVRIDDASLRRVLANLLTNALRATPARGHVRVKAIRVGTMVEIAVEDDGCGLASDKLAQLLDGTPQYRRGTHGFGIAIVHRLIDRVGGSLHASSVEGGGSRFAVRLPIA